MRLTALQLRVDDSEPASERVSRVVEMVRSQAGADLVVLPELWVPGAFGYRGYSASAQPLSGELIREIAAAAVAIGAFVLAGTVIEREGDRLYNTAVLLGPDGSIVHTYRKVHLFGFDRGEAQRLTAGDEVSAYAMPGLVTVGMTTCYDLRFPEIYRLLIDDGAEVIVVPAGWPAARVAHWSVLLRARAIENQAFVVGCNQVGNQEGVELAGHSLVIDPWGQVLAQAGPGEQVVSVELDLPMVAKVRAEFPVLRDRRFGVSSDR